MSDVTVAREALRNNAGKVTFMGVVLLVLGLLAVAAPLATGIAIAYLVGAAVMAAGALQVANALSGRSWGGGLLGLLAIVCGAIMIAHPLFQLAFLTLLLAVYFLVQGIASIVIGLQMRPLQGSGWTIFGGIVSLVLGVLIWSGWPLSGDWAVGTLVGIQLIFSGWAALMLAAAARGAAA